MWCGNGWVSGGPATQDVGPSAAPRQLGAGWPPLRLAAREREGSVQESQLAHLGGSHAEEACKIHGSRLSV